MTDLERSEILNTLESELEQMFFSTEDNQFDASKKCPKCADGKIGLQLGKYGAFIGCNNYPECKYTAFRIIITAYKLSLIHIPSPRDTA